jgi:hypothetical protein
MIRIGDGDGPRRIHPVEPSGRAGDKGKDEHVREPKPVKKPEVDDAPTPQRRIPDPGTGENVDIEV